MKTITKHPNDAKEVFKKCGTCSQTFAHILNREFKHNTITEERATDPLAGGIMNQGYQCGMLWGAALAVGAEASRRYEDPNKAMAMAMLATKHLVASFVERTGTLNCREITGFNLNNTFGLVTFMIKTLITGMENNKCFNLAEQWAPEAIQAAKQGLLDAENNLPKQVRSCSIEVVKKMGGSDKEAQLVAGFAGGLGLSGNACGALSAAVWLKTLRWCENNPGKTPPFLKNPYKKKVLKVFRQLTNDEFECRNITGLTFNSIDEHTTYLQHDGCKQLIEVLAQT